VDQFAQMLAVNQMAQAPIFNVMDVSKPIQTQWKALLLFKLRRKPQPAETGWGDCDNSQGSETPILRLLSGQAIDVLHEIIVLIHALNADDLLAVCLDPMGVSTPGDLQLIQR